MKLLVSDIVRATAAAAGISEQELLGPLRAQRVSRPRQRGMYLARQLCPHASFPEIARRFGRTDHVTSMHAVTRVRTRIAAGELGEIEALLEVCAKLGLDGLPADRGDGLGRTRCRIGGSR